MRSKTRWVDMLIVGACYSILAKLNSGGFAAAFSVLSICANAYGIYLSFTERED